MPRQPSTINHPHVCTIYEVGEVEGQAYIAMELVEGETLSARLASGPLPAEQALRYGLQMADALGHAHDRRVVHRDLKSANVVITPEGRAKVLDFGLARRLSEDELNDVTRSQAALTQPGAVAGTLAYMAPEQLRGLPADERSDIWALGVVLFEIAVGTRPFQGRTGFELSSAILKQAPPLPSQLPANFQAVIARCLEKEPGLRYQRAGEVRAALEAIQTGAVPTRTDIPVQRVPRWALLATGALSLLAIVVAALYFGGWRERVLRSSRPGRIESLAVLPLENLSGDPSQSYLADGMTEELIADLGQISSLRVISRTSAMHYKGTRKTIPEIARELHVDAVVEGSVERAGDQVRITAQLIEALTDRHLWARKYQREFRNALQLQDEVAQAIAREIQVKLTPQEQTRLAGSRRVDPEAYNAYLQGRYLYNQRTDESYRKASEYFKQAINKDPNFAPAWALWAAMAFDPALMLTEDDKRRAREALQKALQLDDSLAKVHTVIGAMKMDDWDWPGAENEFRRAIELNPNYAEAHHTYSHFLMGQGRVAESLLESQRALESDPLNLAMTSHLAWHFLCAGQSDQAIEQARRTLDLDPNYQLAHIFLGAAEEHKGEYAAAVAELQKAVALSAGKPDWGALAELGHAYGLEGNKVQALKIVNRLRDSGPFASFNLAIVHLGLGDKEASLALLKKAVDERAVPAYYAVKKNPVFETLHADPRFQELLRRMNLPQ